MAKKSVNEHCVLTPVKVLPWQIGERNVNDLKRKILSSEKEKIKGGGDSIQKHGGEMREKSEMKVMKRKMVGEKLQESRGCEREAENEKQNIFKGVPIRSGKMGRK